MVADKSIVERVHRQTWQMFAREAYVM